MNRQRTVPCLCLWSGELSIFGFDIDVQPIKINGKTIEEWVKSWVNSWFE